MQTTSIHLSIDVPATSNYNVEELQRKLKAYAMKLIVRGEKKEQSTSKHIHSLSSLRGISQGNPSEETLLNEYLSEKYGV